MAAGFSTAGVEGVGGVAGFEPNALWPNPLDDPNALPDFTAPPEPNGLLPLPDDSLGVF